MKEYIVTVSFQNGEIQNFQIKCRAHQEPGQLVLKDLIKEGHHDAVVEEIEEL